MPHNEEGEFELVLGNKQLLSVLFIVMILLAIFFAMGYVVGRNSAPVDVARREPYVRTDAPSAMPERRPQQKQPEPQQESAPAPAPENSPTEPEAKPLRSIEIGQLTGTLPQAGQTFLQVRATGKPEAEILVELLVKKGFHAFVAPGPTEQLHRVLVGPVKDNAELAKIRGDLEQAGFNKTFVRKY
jgi:DedD protein